MCLDFYQQIPLHINPVVFSVNSFYVRWYALSYLLGFAVVYFLLTWRIRKREDKCAFEISDTGKQKNSEKLKHTVLFDFLLILFVAALLGGRIGYVIFYDLNYFLANPMLVISPYNVQSGQLIGIYGMSYHGALIGVILTGYIFALRKKMNFLNLADFVVVAIPAGYFFGRIGNFLNGELYGRITNSFFGMHFAANSGYLRYPSQLIEAFLEGACLFIVLWIMRNKNFKKGSLFAIYLIGYGLARFVGEQFRQPDFQIGLLLNFFTIGQVFSIGMIFFGIFFLMLVRKMKV